MLEKERSDYVEASQLPDIQLPGQILTFRAAASFVEEALGLEPENIRIGVAEDSKNEDSKNEDSKNYVAQINVTGGPYNQSRKKAVIRTTASIDSFIVKIAKQVVRAVVPSFYTQFLILEEAERCRGRDPPKCDYRKAKAVLKEMLENRPRYDNESALFTWAYVLKETNFPKGEVEKYVNTAKAAALYSRDALAYENWGHALVIAERYRQAVKKYKKAIELRPRTEPYDRWRDKLLYTLTRYEPAIRALSLRPPNVLTYQSWGDALFSFGQYEEAIEKYKKARELWPDAYAYTSWGDALFKLKHYQPAIEKYKKATELKSRSAYAYAGWGDALTFAPNNYKQAFEKYKQATELKPRSIDAYGYWGDALFELGDYQPAIAKYKKVVETDQWTSPTFVEIFQLPV